MNIHKNNISMSRGFTIVELMIATSVFAVVLLVVTAGLAHIGRLYYKGITTVKTQETARAIAEEIGSQLKFAPGEVKHTADAVDPKTYCIGGVQYIYRLNERYDGTASTAGFKKAHATSSNAPCTNTATTTTQMLSPNMWLLDLNIDCASGGDLCDVNVTVAFALDQGVFEGDDVSTKKCKGSPTGGQFCGVANIKTTVLKRVE